MYKQGTDIILDVYIFTKRRPLYIHPVDSNEVFNFCILKFSYKNKSRIKICDVDTKCIRLPTKTLDEYIFIPLITPSL